MTINWFVLRKITHAMWFLPAVFSAFAILVVGGAYFSEMFFPDFLNADRLPVTVSTSAVRSILTIVASSMLAVTVFSLSTMVNLISTVSQSTSPRAVELIVSDRTTQTSISIFIGAFLFAILAIIGLSGEIYSIGGRLILFVATAMVIGAVVWALIRWIGHISRIGRVGETIAQLEKATATALEKNGVRGLYGCSCASGEPRFEHELLAGGIGFLQHFDRDRLQKIADERELILHVDLRPGSYVDHKTRLLGISGPVDEECCSALRDAFTIGHQRTFGYDPEFGLTVLCEIALRALSPAINDPGTAAEVATGQARVLANWALQEKELDATPSYPSLFMHPQEIQYLLAPSLERLAQESNAPEVDAAVLRGLKTLVSVAPRAFGRPAIKIAESIKRKEIARRAAAPGNSSRVSLMVD